MILETDIPDSKVEECGKDSNPEASLQGNKYPSRLLGLLVITTPSEKRLRQRSVQLHFRVGLAGRPMIIATIILLSGIYRSSGLDSAYA